MNTLKTPALTAFECAECAVRIPAKYEVLYHQYIPMSLYWRGTRTRVEVAFCSPQCSLKWHEKHSNSIELVPKTLPKEPSSPYTKE